MAARRLNTYGIALSMFLLMFLMVITPAIDEPNLTFENVSETSGRQGEGGLSDVDCSGYTFEDLFDYNFALFNIDIGEDWATAGMDATAFVNGSNSATVRDNLDELFDGAPGGNNDWISTDEEKLLEKSDPCASRTWKLEWAFVKECHTAPTVA